MRILFFLLAVPLLAQQKAEPELVPVDAQPPRSFAIDGKVVSAATQVAIAGARVELRHGTSGFPLQSVVSELDGAFHFALDEPGDYAVEASNDGYAPASKKLSVDKTNISGVTLPVTLAMLSSAEIRGTVRDGDTKEGLAGLTVSALRVNYYRGQFETLSERTAFTDDQGDFRLVGLTPGDYLLEIKKFPPGTILAGLRADLPAPQTRYPQTIWPGGALASNPVPLAVSSGETDIGYVNLVKIKPGLIRGVVTGMDCAKVSSYELIVRQRFGLRSIEERSVQAPCGTGFTVPDLSPGFYRISAKPLANLRQMAAEDFQVETGSELDIRLPLKEMSSINGSVTFDCKGDCSATPQIRSVGLSPVTLDLPNDPSLWGSTALVNDAGTFHGVMPLSGPLRVVVEPRPEHFFIKRVIYNGADVGTVFQPGASAAIATLRIVLSGQPSELSGTVSEDGQPVLKAHVVLSPWPLVANDGWAGAIVAATGADGRFHFPGLAPGTYRAVSVNSSDWERKDLPGVLNGWLSGAEEIVLGDAESKVVTLK